MRVIAIDGGDEKRDLCKRLGAEEFIDFTKTQDIAAEVMRITKYGAHGVLVTAATKEAYASAPNLLRPGGTVVAVGLPKDPTVLAGGEFSQSPTRRWFPICYQHRLTNVYSTASAVVPEEIEHRRQCGG